MSTEVQLDQAQVDGRPGDLETVADIIYHVQLCALVAKVIESLKTPVDIMDVFRSSVVDAKSTQPDAQPDHGLIDVRKLAPDNWSHNKKRQSRHESNERQVLYLPVRRVSRRLFQTPEPIDGANVRQGDDDDDDDLTSWISTSTFATSTFATPTFATPTFATPTFATDSSSATSSYHSDDDDALIYVATPRYAWEYPELQVPVMD